MSCKPPGEEIAHKTTLTILNKLSNYSWVAKAVLTVAAFALEYGEFWLLPQHLPTELAIIKRVPELTNPEALIKHRNAILEFNNLVKATWQVIDIIFEFEKLKSVHDTKDVPALAPAVEQIPIDVYWAIITIAAIVTQIDCLTTDSEKRQDLSQFGQKISIILSKLRKQISLCKQQIEEAECYKILKILFQTPTEIMEVFKMLIFGKDTPHAPIYEGATKTLVNIEVLKNKDVFLFISTLDISEEEISTFKPIYDHITKLGSRYKIVWLPIVEEWNDRLRSKFETLISKMPWYVLHHFAPIKGIKYIKEEWQFKKDPLVVVLNPQGKILHHNAFHMIRVWGLRGFPFTISIEESLNRTPMESVPVMNGIDPNLYLPTTIKEEKYMITFGGKDREWIQQFSKYAYEITSKRRKYDHLLDQTAGFYACRCAAEPIHVQLNLATYFIEVVNTTSEELSNIAVEVSVWELEGTCPYYKAHENLSFLPKKVTPIVEMKYPKSKNPKPVYFLLLKLYNKSDYRILSRNFYWLHLPGGDYKLLEPYRKKKIPLKITSEVFIEGSTYKLQMHVHNTSKRPDSKSLTFEHDSTARPRDSFVFQLVQ